MKNMTDAEAKKLLDLRPVKFDYITEEDGMSCVAIESEYVAGDTLTVSAGTSSAPGYNNSFALILNLISA